MSLARLEKRVRAIEVLLGARTHEESRLPGWPENYSTDAQLDRVLLRAWQIEKKVEAAGDFRMALACLRAISTFLELAARRRGEFDGSPTNVLNVNLDPETATKLARTYLERHKSLIGDSE